VKSSARAIDHAAIIAIVESGLGVSVMPQLALLNYRSSVQVFPFYPAESRAIVLALSLSQEGLAPAARAMHAHIVESVERWVKRRDQVAKCRDTRELSSNLGAQAIVNSGAVAIEPQPTSKAYRCALSVRHFIQLERENVVAVSRAGIEPGHEVVSHAK
jgi:hypothetical protein